MNPTFPPHLKVLQRSVLILAIIACGAVVVIARSFIYPICFAILLSYLIYPVAKFLEKILRHRGAATLLSVLIAVAVFVGFFVFLTGQLYIFVNDFPNFREQAIENLLVFQNYISDNSGISFSSDEWLKLQISTILEEQENFITQIFNATTSTVVALGIQPVYVFFMLYYRYHFRKFLFHITNKKDHTILEKILSETTSVTKNYVTGIFIVVLILCVFNSVGLLIVGIEFALLFGVISAVLNFIPYFGTLIGGSIPLLYALASPEPSHALGIIILFLIIQFLENNILTPNITGGRVAINPLFTIFAIILGGLGWGIPGMFLSVPFLGIFKIVCQNIKSLRPIAFVLSTPTHDKNLPHSPPAL